VAWAHFFYKVIPFMIYYFLTTYIMKVLPESQSVVRDVANAHTILNIISAIAFYPFIGWGAKTIEKVFPRSEKDKEFGPEYLNLETYQHVE
jgi:Na+/phosphate symporter